MMLRQFKTLCMFGVVILVGCKSEQPTPQEEPAKEEAVTINRAMLAAFEAVKSPATPTDGAIKAKIDLGRMLYYDTRLSKNHDISCNSCHKLDAFGVDGEKTSPGHKNQRGARNSPTVYFAKFHIAQFWDGRAKDLVEQAKGPVLNAVEMAMPSEDYVLKVLKSIPGYKPMFDAAFPGSKNSITYQHMAEAIAAFEEGLVNPSAFDSYLAGDDTALSNAERKGLQEFLNTGCMSCHNGPALGGRLYQKLGAVVPLEVEDPGRFEVTKNEADKGVFKVASLRNITKTAPYFHDGRFDKLEDAVTTMAKHQLGRDLTPEQVGHIVTFLGTLTGKLPTEYIAKPDLPPSGPKTPKPDPT